MVENSFRFNTMLVFRPKTTPKVSPNSFPKGKIVVFSKMCHKN